MTKKKIVEKNREEEKPLLSVSVEKREGRELLWLVVIVVAVFAIILGSYFWTENAKSFSYGGENWVVENYNNLIIYHGRFESIGVRNLTYNLYLRNDPRKNDVPTTGTFDKFKYGGIVGISPKVDRCRGQLSRVMLDLGAFMRRGIGVGPLAVGSTNKFTAVETNRTYTQCDTASDRTIVMIEMGNSSVVQNKINPYCYTIKAENCNDITSVEKFMIKSVADSSKLNK